MKMFDEEDVSNSVDRVVALCEELEETKTYEVALRALAALSCMKLVVGQDKFDNLPAFSRWLHIAAQVVTDEEKRQEKK